jgi:hypothetical protein
LRSVHGRSPSTSARGLAFGKQPIDERLDAFLGLSRGPQIAGSCALAFMPVVFAGVVFAISFGQAVDADRAFGANVAGAMVGGLAEYSSMLLGFQYVVLVALGFYVLSAISGQRPLAWRA